MDEWSSRKPGKRDDATSERDRPLIVEISPSALEQRAAQVGRAAGQTVALLRDAGRRVEQAGRSGDERFSRFRAKARARIDDLRRAIADPESWRKETTRLQHRTQRGYEKARSRADAIVHEYPLQAALAAGVAGFLLGAVTRTWRAKRAG